MLSRYEIPVHQYHCLMTRERNSLLTKQGEYDLMNMLRTTWQDGKYSVKPESNYGK